MSVRPLVVRCSACVLLVMAGWLPARAASEFVPARLRTGDLPSLSPLIVAGGQVFVELTVTDRGTVGRVTPLRVTPPYTQAMTAVLERWLFVPAEQIDRDLPQVRRRPVESTVLVVGIFRAPVLSGPTLASTPPQDVAKESDSTPFPYSLIEPVFPVQARDAGQVLIEAAISPDGRPTDLRVVRSSPAFDGVSLDALRAWRFRPARLESTSTTTVAYVIFGFPQPVVTGAPAGGPSGGP